MSKNKSQNGLRMYPKMFPHQLRAISTYPNPPICHIKNQKKKIFSCIFPVWGHSLVIQSSLLPGTSLATKVLMHRELPPPCGTGSFNKNFRKNSKTYAFFDFSLYGRWEDLDRWKWVVIDVGVILDTSASHSENFFFDIFRSWVGDHSAIP